MSRPIVIFMVNTIKNIIKIWFLTCFLIASSDTEMSNNIATAIDVSVYNGEVSILLNWSFPDSIKVKNTIIYGLDADLIMLSLNHLRFCDNIYLYREAPEFIKSIDPDLEPNETYLLNIKELSIHLHKELSPILEEQSNVDIGEKYRNEKMFDYIFICFMLGNDFLPHFPSINIRTNGIDILIETYRETFSVDEYIFDGVNIKWSNLRKLILKLSEREEEYAIDNFNNRVKIEKRRIANNTIDDKMYKFTSMPTKDLTVEKYINLQYLSILVIIYLTWVLQMMDFQF